MKMVLILYLLGIVAVSANAQIIKENLKRQLLRHLNTQGSSTSTGRRLYPDRCPRRGRSGFRIRYG